MKRAIQLAVAFMAIVLAAVGQAKAGIITIDFDGFAPADPFPTSVEDGIEINNLATLFAVDGGGSVGPFSGANSLHHQGLGPDAQFRLRDTTGDKFKLTNFRAGKGIPNGAEPLTVRGYLAGGLVGTDIFNPNLPVAGAYGLFTPTNLSNVEIDTLVFDMGPGLTGSIHIDDIVLNVLEGSAVPEPSSVALLGIAACVSGVEAARRRRKKGQEATA